MILVKHSLLENPKGTYMREDNKYYIIDKMAHQKNFDIVKKICDSDILNDTKKKALEEILKLAKNSSELSAIRVDDKTADDEDIQDTIYTGVNKKKIEKHIHRYNMKTIMSRDDSNPIRLTYGLDTSKNNVEFVLEKNEYKNSPFRDHDNHLYFTVEIPLKEYKQLIKVELGHIGFYHLLTYLTKYKEKCIISLWGYDKKEFIILAMFPPSHFLGEKRFNMCYDNIYRCSEHTYDLISFIKNINDYC